MRDDNSVEWIIHSIVGGHYLDSSEVGRRFIWIDDGDDRYWAIECAQNGDFAKVGFSRENDPFKAQRVSPSEDTAVILFGLAE